MPVSVHNILELNSRKPVLNSYLKFFSEDGKYYAYLNRNPYKISFTQLNSNLLGILNQMDGTKTINEIITSNSLNTSVFELLNILYKNQFLTDKGTRVLPLPQNTVTLTFFPTTSCNLNCRYCYTNAENFMNAVIDVKKAEAWVDYTLESLPDKTGRIKVLFYGGGEPTMASGEMRYIWNYVKNKCAERELKTKLSCITNGNFTAEVLKWFIEEKANVLFSIDGKRELHDQLRPRKNGKGSFDQAYSNLRQMGDAGLKPGIRATISGINVHAMKDLIDLAKECSAGYVNLEPCSSYGRPGNLNDTTIPVEEFIPGCIEAWKYGLREGIKVSGLPAISIQPGKDFLCNPWSRSSLYLTSEGYLSACTDVTVKSDRSSGVFFAGEVNGPSRITIDDKILQKLKQRSSGIIPECRECFMEYVCNSGCPAKVIRESGDFLNISGDDCRLIQNVSKALLKTLLNEKQLLGAFYRPEEFKFEYKNGKSFEADYISFF